MCLPPVTKSAKVTWYMQAKGVYPEKMHLPHASSLEEKCVPTTSHKVCSSDMLQASKRCPARKDASRINLEEICGNKQDCQGSCTSED